MNLSSKYYLVLQISISTHGLLLQHCQHPLLIIICYLSLLIVCNLSTKMYWPKGLICEAVALVCKFAEIQQINSLRWPHLLSKYLFNPCWTFIFFIIISAAQQPLTSSPINTADESDCCDISGHVFRFILFIFGNSMRYHIYSSWFRTSS